MSLLEEWDDELHRAEAVLEDDTRRHGHLVLLPEQSDPEDIVVDDGAEVDD